jgi:hypothetical protein
MRISTLTGFFIKPHGRLGVAPARRKSAYLEDPDAAVERDGDHIPGFDVAARRSHFCAIDPHVAGRDQRCGVVAGTHDPGVP